MHGLRVRRPARVRLHQRVCPPREKEIGTAASRCHQRSGTGHTLLYTLFYLDIIQYSLKKRRHNSSLSVDRRQKFLVLDSCSKVFISATILYIHLIPVLCFATQFSSYISSAPLQQPMTVTSVQSNHARRPNDTLRFQSALELSECRGHVASPND